MSSMEVNFGVVGSSHLLARRANEGPTTRPTGSEVNTTRRLSNVRIGVGPSLARRANQAAVSG